jgi:hypothetical protein
MDKLQKVDKYLQKYATSKERQIFAGSPDGVENAVVIPVLQERDSLFSSLASLAKNPPADLGRTMVFCVVNNHHPSIAGDDAVADNQETLALLRGLINKTTPPVSISSGLQKECDVIAASGLRLAAVDASSSGMEIPDGDGGVGAARKIGMDAALMILKGQGRGIITCLDADTLVEENYLPAIAAFFRNNSVPAASVGYAHQEPENVDLLTGICRYEIYLRAYVIGLLFAGSPYAFPSIGSTISCTAEAYVAVRGMNRRAVAEDFHFLDKLAKLGKLGFVGETTIHPSARLSHRVAFGTGRKMHYFLAEGKDEYIIHNPDIFMIMREWLAEMASAPERSAEALMDAAENIHPLLREYLEISRFPANWRVIRQNCADVDHLRRQFHVWFDGLKTLKLVHHLAGSLYPPVDMFIGLQKLLKMMNKEIPCLENMPEKVPASDIQRAILVELRRLFPAS